MSLTQRECPDNGFACTPRTEVLRMMFAITLLEGLTMMVGDFLVAFMHTPIGDDEPPINKMFSFCIAL